MEKCLIVAVADNWAIGRGNDMPWHISEDLKFFKRTTLGCPVIMGRRTFESIGRTLPGRLNIVVSRGFDAPAGVVLVPSLEAAYEAASAACDAQGSESAGHARCFVMGGGKLYSAAVDSVDTMYITHVHTQIDDADTFFPAIDLSLWQVRERSGAQTDPASGLSFEFVTYSR